MSEMIAVFVLGLVWGGLIVASWKIDPTTPAEHNDTEQRVGRPL